MQNVDAMSTAMTNADAGVKNTGRNHGGNIYKAARRHDIDIRKIVDFSSNVNPLGPSSAALRAAKRSLPLIGRYPDPDMRDMRRAIARYFGIKFEHVMCGNGSNGIIHLLPRVFRPRKVLVPVPTYTEYAAAVTDAGAAVVPLILKDREGFRVDPLEALFALKEVDMAFLCNPNNPTGQVITKQEMLEIARYARQYNVRLVVDESFMDFADTETVIKEAVQSSNMICLRSFSLLFGMPGLRLGYAVSDESTIAAVREQQECWNVTIPAEHAAIAALNDWSHIRKTRKLVDLERERLLSALRLLPGIEPFPSAANFILVKVNSFDVPLLVEHLAKRAMLVRDCSSYPGLDGPYIRIAVRTRSENRRLMKALREILIR